MTLPSLKLPLHDKHPRPTKGFRSWIFPWLDTTGSASTTRRIDMWSLLEDTNDCGLASLNLSLHMSKTRTRSRLACIQSGLPRYFSHVNWWPLNTKSEKATEVDYLPEPFNQRVWLGVASLLLILMENVVKITKDCPGKIAVCWESFEWIPSLRP